MALPLDTLSDEPQVATLLSPDEAVRDLLVDYEMGGVDLNDPTQGMLVKPWVAWSDGVDVWVGPHPSRTPATLVFTGAAITEVSLSFDQNMKPTLALVDGGVTKLHWYDTAVAATVTTSYDGVVSPFLSLDDKREIQSAIGGNDILFAYLKEGRLCYRQQRERFNIERTLGADVSQFSRIRNFGMGANNRMQFVLEAA